MDLHLQAYTDEHRVALWSSTFCSVIFNAKSLATSNTTLFKVARQRLICQSHFNQYVIINLISTTLAYNTVTFDAEN